MRLPSILLIILFAAPTWAQTETRRFLMGFTPFPYDLTQVAQDATYDTIAGNADLMDSFGININGSAAQQVAYVERLLEETQRLEAAFVIWFVVRDYDPFVTTVENFGIDATLFPIWRDTGLIDGAGESRPALAIWTDWLLRLYRK